MGAGDITYIPLRGRQPGYLSLLMDLFSRRIVGWEHEESMTDALVLSSLRKAIHQRRPDTGLIRHSDRGGSMPHDGTTTFCAVPRPCSA